MNSGSYCILEYYSIAGKYFHLIFPTVLNDHILAASKLLVIHLQSYLKPLNIARAVEILIRLVTAYGAKIRLTRWSRKTGLSIV